MSARNWNARGSEKKEAEFEIVLSWLLEPVDPRSIEILLQNGSEIELRAGFGRLGDVVASGTRALWSSEK